MISDSSPSENQERARLGYDSSDLGFLELLNLAGNPNVRLRAIGDSYFDGGNVGIRTVGPDALLTIAEHDISITQTDFTQEVTNAGILIDTSVGSGLESPYLPGLFWKTFDDNENKPKAGIYLRRTALGTSMYFGTSNDYSTGITNDALVIRHNGNVGIGTVSPEYKLEIKDYSDFPAINIGPVDGVNGIIDVNTQNDNRVAAFRCKRTAGTNQTTWEMRIPEDSKSLAFYNNGDKVTITDEGNIGIGIDLPQRKLHISGGEGLIEKNHNGETAFTVKNLAAGGASLLEIETSETIGGNPRFQQSGKLTELSFNDKFQLRRRGQQDLTLYVDEDFNVGIGNIYPKNKLDIEGATVIGSNYAGTEEAPSEGLLVEGNVGIGTYPSTKLEIKGDIRLSKGNNRKIDVPDQTDENNGNSLTIKSGNGFGSNKDGGNIHLLAGSKTGNGEPGEVRVGPDIIAGYTSSRLVATGDNITCAAIFANNDNSSHVYAGLPTGYGLLVSGGDDQIAGARINKASAENGLIVWGRLGVFTEHPTENLEVYAGNVKVSSNQKYLIGTVEIKSGENVPSGDDEAPKGSLYLRTDGGANSTLYVKTGPTTWTAK